MKKRWHILLLIALLLVGYGVFVFAWYSGGRQSPEQTLPSETSDPAAVTTTTPTTTAPAPETTAEPTTEPTTEPATEPTTEPPLMPPDETRLSTGTAFVYDLSREKMLYTRGDQNQQLAPASLTKLLTALMALEYLDPETIVTAGEEAGWVAEGSSVAAIYPGNQLTAEKLLQGMLMQSGNDAAYVLAVAIGKEISGSPDATSQDAYQIFLEAVGEKCQELGLTGSCFINPDGYDREGHYSTPADLLTLARLAVRESLICKYTSCYRELVTFESGQEYIWLNTNLLLNPESPYYSPEAIGLKTGSTSNAGYCLISAFERDGRILLIGVMNCPSHTARFEDVLYLYNHFIEQ